MDEMFEKLLDIGALLKLSKQESMVFAYKAIGMSATEISQKMKITSNHLGDCSSRVYKKLHITKDKNRNERIKELGDEFLKYYDLVESISQGNTYKILDTLYGLDNALGR